MQTFRLLPAIAAVTLCATPFLTRADDTPAQAAARAALMQDMNDTGNAETPPPSQATPPPVYVPPAAPQTPPPEVVAPAPITTVPAAVATQGSSTNLALPPVEQETVPTSQVTQYPVNPAPANAASNSMWPSANTNTPSMTSGAMSEQPMTAPSLPISDGQRQQLQALLQQYEANQITSSQYQAQRAKILAGQ